MAKAFAISVLTIIAAFFITNMNFTDLSDAKYADNFFKEVVLNTSSYDTSLDAIKSQGYMYDESEKAYKRCRKMGLFKNGDCKRFFIFAREEDGVTRLMYVDRETQPSWSGDMLAIAPQGQVIFSFTGLEDKLSSSTMEWLISELFKS